MYLSHLTRHYCSAHLCYEKLSIKMFHSFLCNTGSHNNNKATSQEVFSSLLLLLSVEIILGGIT